MRTVFAPILFCLLGCAALAAPVSDTHARNAAGNWLRLHGGGFIGNPTANINDMKTFTDDQGQPLYYIASLTPSGFVIVPADDDIEPIIGFAATGTYDPSPDNPLGALVQKDLPGRTLAARKAAHSPVPMVAGGMQSPPGPKAKWQRLAGKQSDSAGLLPSASTGSVADIRVDPLIQSRWGQSTVMGDYCFNYYTPNHYVCGCTATALAQILRFHQHPTNEIGVSSHEISIDRIWQTAYTRGGDGSGGPYNWTQMPLVPGAGLTIVQRQAIGSLCHDAGVSISMQYSAAGSGAWVRDCRTALVETFGYASAIAAGDGYSDIGAPLTAMLNPNLDAGCPCLLGLSNADVGHAMVVDGYGYDLSTLYHHLNMGLGGMYDAWYNLPDVSISQYTFNVVDECVYNIFPIGTGEIISGRVVDAAGNPLAGVTVTAERIGGGTCTAASNARGVYALAKVASNASYTLTASKSGYSFASRAATTSMSADSGSPGNVWGVDFAGAPALPGDINGDGYVNVGDLQILVACWNSHPGDAGYNARADLNGDGQIGASDLQVLVANWARSL